MFRCLLYRSFRQIYSISNWARNRFTPMGGLLFGGMIGSGIFSVDTRQSLSFQIFAFISALLLLALLNMFTFRGKFRVKRVLPEYATVRQPVKYKVIVENLEQRPQPELLLYDDLQTSLPGFQEFISANDPGDSSRNWFDRIVGYPRMINLIQKKRGASIEPAEIGDLPGQEKNEVVMELIPRRRGYIHFTRTRIARPDPLGLMRAIKFCNCADDLLILPKTYTLPPVQLYGKRKYQHGGMNQASTVGDAQEFMSLRDYKPGDPLRAIHWRSFAKSGHPVVKEYQDEFFVRQGLLLDTFIEDKANEVFEEAVALAASFVVSEKPQDALLDLMFVGTESYRFTSGRGLNQMENMLEILACVEPCYQPAFNTLVELILQHARVTSGIICILLDWDKKRQDLMQKLISQDIPVLVLLLTNQTDLPAMNTAVLGIYADNFHVLHIDDIQARLDRLNRL
ncbi:MAG: hypothetical protein A3G96_02860 [Gammaproteobacteria bacterium RIFCSPLOWO2_12_FULL_52_10]|nr:MAG: hypothetical protein A3G96_02860 [Gammaproteobacteria bacterium RIFCSPLOWO2_12_FULL_52_10]